VVDRGPSRLSGDVPNPAAPVILGPMSGEDGGDHLGVEEHLEQLAAAVSADRAQIDALRTRVEEGLARADLS
jgi:hypothetical protein